MIRTALALFIFSVSSLGLACQLTREILVQHDPETRTIEVTSDIYGVMNSFFKNRSVRDLFFQNMVCVEGGVYLKAIYESNTIPLTDNWITLDQANLALNYEKYYHKDFDLEGSRFRVRFRFDP
jgi:hypothetical protein